MHSNYNRTGLQSEKDQNFGSDYFLCQMCIRDRYERKRDYAD